LAEKGGVEDQGRMEEALCQTRVQSGIAVSGLISNSAYYGHQKYPHFSYLSGHGKPEWVERYIKNNK
jgi:hypothetical protein